MDPVRNPYSPGAGRTPSALVGRDGERSGWKVALDRSELNRMSQPVALYGLRGVGKTVLLSDFTRTAERRGWLVAQVEAGSGKSLREALGEALHGPLVDLVKPTAGTKLIRALKTALSFKASYDANGVWNFGLDLSGTSGGGADTGVLETDIAKLVRDLSSAAEEEGIGLAILIDEAQELTEAELTAVCSTAHTAGQNDWRFLFALAGLPSLPRVLAEAKSYSERLFVFEKIEQLENGVAKQALIEPAAAEGIDWDDEAATHVVAETKGYPYFLQQFGQETWNTATGRTITLQDALVGAARASATLDSGFFRARWDRATRGEQKYLRAMALDGNSGSSSGDVAERLGQKAKSFGPARANLISKGLIYAPEHGVVAFTVPLMAEFITRQPAPVA